MKARKLQSKNGARALRRSGRRREAVMASAPTLRPNFKPKTGITESQLSKFQELHRRRLQIKAKSKIHKREKGANGKGESYKKAIEDRGFASREQSRPTADSTTALETEGKVESLSSEVDDATRNAARKTRQKLHWGLDTKERWERKSNM